MLLPPGGDILGHPSRFAPNGTFGRMSPANMSARYGTIGPLAIATSVRLSA